MEIAKVTSKGQITIPKAVRDDLGLESGDKVIWIKNGKRWEVTHPERVSSITPEERATSDRLKAKFIAETAAKYDLDVDKIMHLARTKTPEELLLSIQEKMAGTAEELGLETEHDVANYIKSMRNDSSR